jgi:hypothetical protein
MADRVFGLSVGRRQWWGLGLTAAGLILLAVTIDKRLSPARKLARPVGGEQYEIKAVGDFDDAVFDGNSRHC